MRCYCYECIENESGYCGCPDYVVVNEMGKCYSLLIIACEDCFEEADHEGD